MLAPGPDVKREHAVTARRRKAPPARGSAATRKGAARPRQPRPAKRLTQADLLVLAMLAERPTHGYDLVAARQSQEGADAAPVSRAQVYYSLKKLVRLGLIVTARDSGPAAGPEREPFRLTAAGRRSMVAALSQPEWARQRPPIPFHLWLQLVAQGDPVDRAAVLRERRAFLDEQIAADRRALAALGKEPGSASAVSAAVLAHAIEVSRLERELLDAVEPMLR